MAEFGTPGSLWGPPDPWPVCVRLGSKKRISQGSRAVSAKNERLSCQFPRCFRSSQVLVGKIVTLIISMAWCHPFVDCRWSNQLFLFITTCVIRRDLPMQLMCPFFPPFLEPHLATGPLHVGLRPISPLLGRDRSS